MLYFRHPSSLDHDPRLLSPDHPDTPERISAIEAAMSQVGWLGCELRAAPAATERELEFVHSAAHVRRIRDLCAAGGGRSTRTRSSARPPIQAALHAAGGACEMVRALMRGEARAGFCAMRPSGHHAERIARWASACSTTSRSPPSWRSASSGCERVLIIDWDVHHGNGTAEIFRRRATCCSRASTNPGCSRAPAPTATSAPARARVHDQRSRAARVR